MSAIAAATSGMRWMSALIMTIAVITVPPWLIGTGQCTQVRAPLVDVGEPRPGTPSQPVDHQSREHPGEKAVHVRGVGDIGRSEEHTSELQSRFDLVCRLLLEKKINNRGKKV